MKKGHTAGGGGFLSRRGKGAGGGGGGVGGGRGGGREGEQV